MTRKFCVVLLLLAFATPLVAQQRMGPPKVLQIQMEIVKPGKGPAHDKHEAAWTAALVNAKYKGAAWLGMNSVSGPSEAWWLVGFDSFDAFEKEAKMQEASPTVTGITQQMLAGDADFLNGGRSVLCAYREDLSNAGEIKLGEMRYFNVRTIRVRPGHNSEYEDIRKMVVAAQKQANVPNVHNAVYQVASGAPNGTFLIFTPLKTLAEADAPPNQAYRDALGDSGRAKIADLQSKSILSSEDAIFAFNPKMSNMAPETVAQDPGFWKPKPMMAKAAAAASDKPKPKEGK